MLQIKPKIGNSIWVGECIDYSLGEEYIGQKGTIISIESSSGRNDIYNIRMSDRKKLVLYLSEFILVDLEPKISTYAKWVRGI